MGTVETFTLPISPLKQDPRRIWVYLPDSYAKTRKKYDVLYMFDGHNLFSDETATYGKSWGIKDYLDRTGIDLVVIGQDCSHVKENRMSEYCPYPPFKDPKRPYKMKADGAFTAEWFAKVLKPECEKRYRIYKNREHVGIGGSSMGGLMAEYCVTAFNDVYSKAACISPASYYCREALNQKIEETEFKKTRVYLDMGSEERTDKTETVWMLAMMLETSHLFTEKGCVTWPHINVGAGHNEASWEKIVPLMIEYLYPELY